MRDGSKTNGQGREDLGQIPSRASTCCRWRRCPRHPTDGSLQYSYVVHDIVGQGRMDASLELVTDSFLPLFFFGAGRPEPTHFSYHHDIHGVLAPPIEETALAMVVAEFRD
jgi:hypothetical protein